MGIQSVVTNYTQYTGCDNIIIIYVYQLGMYGRCTQRVEPVQGATHSQENLKTTNMVGQLMYGKNLLQGLTGTNIATYISINTTT